MAETAAPTWLPLVFLAIPVLIILGLGSYAIRGRRAWSSAQKAEARRRSHGPAVGAGGRVDDPALVSRDALVSAMAVDPDAEERLSGGEPFAATAGALGLRSKVSTSTTLLEPTVAWGERKERQLVIRIGPDEKLEGDTMLGTNRHVRDICTLRVESPAFRLREQGGRLVADPGSAPDVAAVLAPLSASEIWGDVHARGDVEGIVVSRNSIIDPAGRGFVDILWLAEHLADELGLPPLAPKRVGPAFRVSYDWGRKVPG